MESLKADKLIKQIWSIQERLRAISNDLTLIENAIADEVPDDK